MAITVAKFNDVSQGTQPGQFTIGEREGVASLADLDPVYKRLLDEPVTAIVAVTGADGLPNLTPVWFDYEGNTVLLNLAAHRKKTSLRTFARAPAGSASSTATAASGTSSAMSTGSPRGIPSTGHCSRCSTLTGTSSAAR